MIYDRYILSFPTYFTIDDIWRCQHELGLWKMWIWRIWIWLWIRRKFLRSHCRIICPLNYCRSQFLLFIKNKKYEIEYKKKRGEKYMFSPRSFYLFEILKVANFPITFQKICFGSNECYDLFSIHCKISEGLFVRMAIEM